MEDSWREKYTLLDTFHGIMREQAEYRNPPNIEITITELPVGAEVKVEKTTERIKG